MMGMRVRAVGRVVRQQTRCQPRTARLPMPSLRSLNIHEKLSTGCQKPAPLHWTACLKLCFVLATTKSKGAQRHKDPSGSSNLNLQDVSDQLQRVGGGKDDDWHGWQPADVKPLVCRQVIESSHPYAPSTDTFQTIHFPGAKKISLYFDQLSATESIYDYVVIYKDESCTEPWGKRKKYTGSSGSTDWPGPGAPSTGDTCRFVPFALYSDASQQDWGSGGSRGPCQYGTCHGSAHGYSR